MQALRDKNLEFNLFQEVMFCSAEKKEFHGPNHVVLHKPETFWFLFLLHVVQSAQHKPKPMQTKIIMTCIYPTYVIISVDSTYNDTIVDCAASCVASNLARSRVTHQVNG